MTRIYNPVEHPLWRISSMINYELIGMPRQRKIRHMILTHLTGYEVEKTSTEIPQELIVAALDQYFPDWRIAKPLKPPKETSELIQQLAKGYSYILSKQTE